MRVVRDALDAVATGSLVGLVLNLAFIPFAAQGTYGPFLVLIAAIIWAAKGFFEVYAWAVVWLLSVDLGTGNTRGGFGVAVISPTTQGVSFPLLSTGAQVVIMVLASVAVVWLSYEPGRGWRAGAAEQSYLYRLLSPRLFTTVAAAVYVRLVPPTCVLAVGVPPSSSLDPVFV